MSLLQRDKRHNKGSVGPEAKISPESLWIPPPVNQQAEKAVTVLAGRLDPGIRGKLDGSCGRG